MPATPWPTEIRYLSADRVLQVTFDTGREVRLPAELLRVESPSAEVQGHGGPGAKTIVAGKRNVTITQIDPVGHYAVRLVFDDGHDTGIYSWATLLDYADRQDALWHAYLDALATAGLSREP